MELQHIIFYKLNLQSLIPIIRKANKARQIFVFVVVVQTLLMTDLRKDYKQLNSYNKIFNDP